MYIVTFYLLFTSKEQFFGPLPHFLWAGDATALRLLSFNDTQHIHLTILRFALSRLMMMMVMNTLVYKLTMINSILIVKTTHYNQVP